MMKRLACVAFSLVLGLACSWGRGTPEGTAEQQGAAPAGAQAPAAGAPPAAAAPGAPATASSGGQPAAGQAPAGTQPAMAAGRSPAPPAAPQAASGQAAAPPAAQSAAGSPVTAPPAAPAAGVSPAAAGQAQAAVAPPAPPQPQFREVIVAAGMTMTVALETAVSSDKSKVEEAVRGRLTKPIVVDGVTAVPEGAQVYGSVLEARQSGRVKGLASVAFRFDRLRVGEEFHAIRTARIAREAGSTRTEDAQKIGVGAAAGAVVGAIAGGKKGAAAGAAVGAGAGTGVVVATRGEEVHFAAGSVLTVRVDEPIKLQVPVK